MGVVAQRVGIVELAADDIDHLLDIVVEAGPAPFADGVDDVLVHAGLERAPRVHRPFVLRRPVARRHQDRDLLQRLGERDVVAQIVAELVGLIGEPRIPEPDRERAVGAPASGRSDLLIEPFLVFRHLLGF